MTRRTMFFCAQIIPIKNILHYFIPHNLNLNITKHYNRVNLTIHKYINKLIL